MTATPLGPLSTRARAASALLAIGVLFATAACTPDGTPRSGPTTRSSDSQSPSPDASSDAPTGPERFTPLVIRSISPDPVAVTGSDGREHLVYELEVQNASPRPATITKVETLADQGAVVATLEGDAVTALSMVVGDYALPPVPADVVPPGRSVLLIMEAVFDDADSVPARLEHRLTASFGDFDAGQGDFALNNFADETVGTGGVVTVSDAQPEVVGPPLSGSGWVAVNGCCGLSPHRGAMLPVGGRINGSERYAIDWSRFDLDARPIVDFTTGTQATFSGDPTDNTSYYTFGQPALAIADGTVVTAVDGLQDAPPHVFLTLPLADLGGNRIVLKIREGVYALYGHLKEGSVEVEVGDTVTRGQVIAELGNSGNTSESHLHFHVMDGPEPLTSTNLAWELDSFEFAGMVEPDTVDTAGDGERSSQLPLMYSAITVPDAQ